MKRYNTGETENELRREYNFEGSELRKAQLKMLEMLKFLDKICKDNNITYFIAYGTLLGAKRHSGFIPWDDDADIIISPDGLKKIREIINSGDYPYVVQDHSVDKGFVRHYNVLRDLHSEYIKDEFIHNQRKYKGIQVDLFPYGFGVFSVGRKIINVLSSFNEQKLVAKHSFLSNLLFGITKYAVIPLLKTISLTQTKKYLYLGYENGWNIRYKYEDIFPLKDIEFEGYSFCCPRNVDNVLITDYGMDYNNLPPKEERNHHSVDCIVYYD